MLNHGLIYEGKDGFGMIDGERSESGAIAAYKNQGFHGLILAWYWFDL